MGFLDYSARYVNLAHRVDRNEHMKRELARVGVEAQRFEAIKTADWRGDESQVIAMRNRTPGAIGCYFSQLEVIVKGASEGMNPMVLEDDTLFANDFLQRLSYIAEFLDKREWAICWLGATCHNYAQWHPDLLSDMYRTSDPRMVRTYGAFSTHGYVVNYKHVPDVLSLLYADMPKHWGIDHGMITSVQRKLPCYAFIPGSLYQVDNRSDIGINQDGTPAITRFSGFVRTLGPYCWCPTSMFDFDATSFTTALPMEIL